MALKHPRNTHQRILITGGAGFIGSHLAETLIARGDDVVIIDDLSTGSFDNIAHLTAHPNFHYVIESISNPMVMDRLVSECDVIYHLAAVVGVELIVEDPAHVIETNILGTHVVLQTAARYRKKILVASTSEVYGKSAKIPFSEEDDRVLGATSKSRWAYAETKAIDEFLALAYAQKFELPVVICRFFNTVGPRQTGQYGMVIPRLVQQALRKESVTVYGDGSQSRCFCNVKDVIRAILTLMQDPQAEGQIFNIGSTEEISITDLARKVVTLVRGESALADPESIIYIPYEKAYGAGFEDMQRRMPDIGKINALCGWQPEIALEETLKQVRDYYRSEEN